MTDPGDEPSEETTRASDGGLIKRDAGRPSSATSTSKPGTSTGTGSGGSSINVSSGKDGGTPIVSTSGDPLGALGGILGGAAPVSSSSDGGKPAATTTKDGGVDHCANAICFDVFDCAIFHPDALDCGFTACVNFVCK